MTKLQKPVLNHGSEEIEILKVKLSPQPSRADIYNYLTEHGSIDTREVLFKNHTNFSQMRILKIYFSKKNSILANKPVGFSLPSKRVVSCLQEIY